MSVVKGDNTKYYDKKIESYKKRVRWLSKIMMEQIQMIRLYKECKDCLINEIFNKDKIPKKDKQKKDKQKNVPKGTLASERPLRVVEPSAPTHDIQKNENESDNQNIDSEQNDKKTADN